MEVSEEEIRAVSILLEGVAYPLLVRQLIKDITRAGCEINFSAETPPHKLISSVYQLLYNLLNQDFHRFSHLMYLADVSQKAFLTKDTSDQQSLASLATVLLFKREVEKVQYKTSYKK